MISVTLMEREARISMDLLSDVETSLISICFKRTQLKTVVNRNFVHVTLKMIIGTYFDTWFCISQDLMESN